MHTTAHQTSPRRRGLAVSLALAAFAHGACASDTASPYEGAQLVTAGETGADAISFEARWSGPLTLAAGCLVLSQGETYVVVAPAGSQLVGDDPDDVALRVDGDTHPLGRSYAGGGAYLDADDERISQIAGASECVSRTGASGVVLINAVATESIDPICATRCPVARWGDHPPREDSR